MRSIAGRGTCTSLMAPRRMAPRRWTPRPPRPHATCSCRCSTPCPILSSALTRGLPASKPRDAAALAAIPGGPAETNGVALGQAAAAAILELRASDGSNAPWVDPAFPQGTEPGEWRFTPEPEAPQFAFAPNGEQVTPFVLKRGSQFRPQAPYHLASTKYAADYNEIKALGGNGTTTPSAPTADQTEIGLFWIESSPLSWNRLARALSAERSLELWENARLFTLLNLAMADGYIASWEAKYHYRCWRPITAIRLGDTDGQSEYRRGRGLDAAAVDLPDARSRLRSRDSGRRGGGDPETLLRHRRPRVHRLQHHAPRRVDVRRSRCGVALVFEASPRRPTRMRCRESISVSISGGRSKKAWITDARLRSTRFTSSSSRDADR